MSSISCCKSIEDKSDVYRGKGCMEKFCEFLRKLAIKIIYFFKNEFVKKKSTRNDMKTHRFVILVKKNLKINI